MKIIDQSHEILTPISEGGLEELKLIEKIGRTCYKSEDRITEDGESAKRFVRMLIQNGHEAMIEHVSISVKFITDRGTSHEIVRHRIASYAQESTRYCNYSKDSKYPDGITVIYPVGMEHESPDYLDWKVACEDSEHWYFQAIKRGATPQMARAVLNNSLKTELIMTTNLREWRNVFRLRCAKAAHPQIRALMTALLKELQTKIPVVFDDIDYWEEDSK